MLIKGYCKTYRNLQLITNNKKQVTFKVTCFLITIGKIVTTTAKRLPCLSCWCMLYLYSNRRCPHNEEIYCWNYIHRQYTENNYVWIKSRYAIWLIQKVYQIQWYYKKWIKSSPGKHSQYKRRVSPQTYYREKFSQRY